MRLDISQQMKMDQRMVLAPRMIQSMEILQLPLLALQERIEQELLSNPMLELEDLRGDEDGEDNDSSTAVENDSSGLENEQALQIGGDKDKSDDYSRLDNMGDDFGDYMARAEYTRPRKSEEPDRKLEAMQNTAAPTQTLRDHLHEQWRFVEAEPMVKQAGTVIIDFIEDTGYLTVDLPSLEEYVKGEVSSEQMGEALRLVQGLEPGGIGARTLAECLLLQLDSLDIDGKVERELITNHLKDLEMNHYPAIMKKTGYSLETIQKAIKTLSRLDPRPGLQYGHQETHYILPDVIVDYHEESDDYTARLTDGSLPTLKINEDYQQMLKTKELAGEAKDYLTNSARSARWLIESIQQRKTTLLRVVHYVLHTQREFLDKGALYLKPLPMVDVADKLGIHVGTVSRAVSGKYVQTPIGIFPLRYFFSGGTETADGDSMSWDAIKAKLQEIVDGENKSKPFNDDELVKELAKHGIKVARRTVAKYRGLMNIPTAQRRKQFT